MQSQQGERDALRQTSGAGLWHGSPGRSPTLCGFLPCRRRSGRTSPARWTPEHISARDLEEAIRERDEARKHLETADRELGEAQKALRDTEAELAETKDAAQKMEAMLREAESRPVEVAVDETAVQRAVEEAKAAVQQF